MALTFQPDLSASYPIMHADPGNPPIYKTIAEIRAIGIRENKGNSFFLIDTQGRQGLGIRYFYAPATMNNLYFASGAYLFPGYPQLEDYYLGVCSEAIYNSVDSTVYAVYGDNIYNVGVGANFSNQTLDGVTYKYHGSDDSGYKSSQTIYVDTVYQNMYVDNNPLVTYNWKSWTSLRGNDGRYRASLTKIKEESIGDFSGQITGSVHDMDYISSQVDMIPVIQNMLYNTEQIVAWSGNDCWMTLTVHDVSGMPNRAQLMFKLYAAGHSTTTPLFSMASEIIVTGTVPDKHFYLAFVYDDDAQAALFCPVRVTNTDSYIWGYLNNVSEIDMLNIWQWLQMTEAGEDDRPDDPYDTGTTDNGGNDGVIQPPDEVNPGQLPTLDATTKGLFTVYLPTESQLADIASFMWSDGVLDNFKKYFSNFNQNVIALYVLPYAPTNPPTKPFKVGRIESDTITAVGYLNQRFVSIDMGSFTVKPRWGSYLDYAPYTKFEIYLPGIGMQVLDTDDIMSVTDKDGNVSTTSGSIISLEYHVDLITGVCVAYVKINNDVKYQFPGKLGYSIPLTGEDYGRMITAFATVAAGVAGGIAYGGISAPLKNPAIGHMVGGEVSAAVAGTVNAMKPEVHRSGNLSCEASALSTDTPYLIRTMPNKPELVNQQVFTGFPSYKSGVLGDFDGYTECIDAHVEGISCTEDERKMLIEWLRKGVIL